MGYLFRAQWRRRWAAWLAMGALVGVAAGAVIAAAIGATRTMSANDRLLTASNAFDVGIPLYCGGAGPEAPSEAALTACLEQIRGLPGVTDAVRFQQLGQVITTTDGVTTQPAADDPCYSGPGVVLLGADPSGRFGNDLNRYKLLEGRVAAPDAPREVVIAPEMSERLDLHPGDGLIAYPYASCDEPPEESAPYRLEIVGVGAAPYLVRPPTGEYINLVAGSPALLEALPPDPNADPRAEVALVAVAGGDAAVEAFLDTAADLGVPIEVGGVQRQAFHAENVERGLRPQAVALGLVALLAGLAAMAVLGAALYRQTAVDTADDAVLGVLGLEGRQLLGLGARRGLVIAVSSMTAAGFTAYLLSGEVLSGLARLVDPEPGRQLDLLLVPGLVAVGAFVTAVVLGGSVRMSSARTRDRAVHRPSVVATRAATLGGPATAVAGIRMALERDGGTRRVPVLSSMAGVLVGLTVLVATVTFSASLQHLDDSPHVVGWNWSFGVPMPEDGDPEVTAAAVTERLASHPDVAGTATGSFWAFFTGGLGLGPTRQTTSLLAFGPGDVGPTVLSGRAPAGSGEILLGAETLADLGLSVGDEVDLVVTNETQTYAGPPSRTSAPFEIVGTGVLPINGVEGGLGQGAATTLDGMRRMFPETATEVVWVRLAPGASSTAVDEAITSVIGPEWTEESEIFGGELITETLVNTDEVDRLPLALAGLVGLMAAGVLAHVIVTSVRVRRRDLALLRTVGFTRRQVQASVGWQVTILSGGAVISAVPLGVAAGRAVWNRYAESLGALPEPVVPLSWLVLTAGVVVVLANVLAFVPAWLASRTSPAAALRAE